MTTAPPGPFIASTRAKVVNFVLFQTVWAACVLGAARGMPWLGAWVAAALLPIYLACLPSRERLRELGLIALAGIAGTIVDSILLGSGVIGFPDHAMAFPGDTFQGTWFVPPWIAVLWFAVGTMLRSSLSWLGRDLRIAVGLSAVTGPLSFLSGERLDATLVPHGPATLAVLAFEYAVLLPILLRVARGPAIPAAPSTDPSFVDAP